MIDFKTILAPSKTIAVVGLSDDPSRPSYQIATYLLSVGFTVVPVNPNITSFKGIEAYPSLSSIPPSIPIDIVNIFRRSEAVLSVVQELIQTQRKAVVWMQEGVVSQSAKQLAEAHGLTVVMDTCIMKQHFAL